MGGNTCVALRRDSGESKQPPKLNCYKFLVRAHVFYPAYVFSHRARHSTYSKSLYFPNFGVRITWRATKKCKSLGFSEIRWVQGLFVILPSSSGNFTTHQFRNHRDEAFVKESLVQVSLVLESNAGLQVK